MFRFLQAKRCGLARLRFQKEGFGCSCDWALAKQSIFSGLDEGETLGSDWSVNFDYARDRDRDRDRDSWRCIVETTHLPRSAGMGKRLKA